MTQLTIDGRVQPIALLPTRDAVLFPGAVTELRVGRPCSVAAIRWAMENGGRLAVVLQKSPSIDTPGPDDLHRVATIGEVIGATRESAEAAAVSVVGVERVALEEISPALLASTRALGWEPIAPAMPNHFDEALRGFISRFLRKQLNDEANARLVLNTVTDRLGAVASLFDVTPAQLQKMLETGELELVVRELERMASPSMFERFVAWFRR